MPHRRAVPALAWIALGACACSRTDGSGAATSLERTSLHNGEPSIPVACGPHGLPPDRHFVADGLCARVVAHAQGPLRSLAFAPNGDLFAATADGEVRRYRDVDHDGLFAPDPPETVVWAKAGPETSECRIDGQDVYCRTKGRVRRWRSTPDRDEAGAGEDVVVGVPEGARSIGVWDGFLYVAGDGVARRFTIATPKAVTWKQGEAVPGLRGEGALARDEAGRIVDAPARAIAIVGEPSRAALPARWQRGALVADGSGVAWSPPREGEPAETVFGGGRHGAPRAGEWSWRVGDASDDPVRTSGVAIGPDGALYVSSEGDGARTSAPRSGAIYRIARLGR